MCSRSRIGSCKNGALELRQLSLRGAQANQQGRNELWTHGCSRPSTEQSCSSFRLQEKGKLAAADHGDISLTVGRRLEKHHAGATLITCLPRYTVAYIYIRVDLGCDDLRNSMDVGNKRKRREEE